MSFTLVGDKALMHALKVLPDRIERRVIGNAARASMRPFITAAKQNARKLGRGKEKIAARRSRRATNKAIEDAKGKGADYRLAETIKSVTRTYHNTKVVVSGPVWFNFGLKGRVSHLVEEGHEIKLPRRGIWKYLLKHRAGGRVRPYPFMKPAWDATKTRAKQVLIQKLRAGIEREAALARGR